jgi:hypothetical protein
VQAVLNEQIDLAQLGEQRGETAATRADDISPLVGESIVDSCTKPLAPELFNRRKINAPKMAASVSLQRFENAARCDSVRYAGLDNFLRLEVTRKTPD